MLFPAWGSKQCTCCIMLKVFLSPRPSCYMMSPLYRSLTPANILSSTQLSSFSIRLSYTSFWYSSYSLKVCSTREALPSLTTMGETTPLLLRTNRSFYDLSTPLHAYHSPALSLRQRILLAVRATIAVYLSIAFSLDMLHGILYTQRGKQFVFEASNVSLMIQVVYYWVTTVRILNSRHTNPLSFPTAMRTSKLVGTFISFTV